jgi:hypothetical protein
MAQTVVAASLTLDSTQAETSVKSFKAQLASANNDLIAITNQFGKGSEQAEAAAKRVVELKAAIKDAKDITDKLTFNPAENSVKSFKAQLREATNDLIKIQDQFGETSAEATAAAKSVAQLRDKINDAKAISEAFNPDAKFQAFTKVLQGSAAGVTALTGAMALFGSESQDVQKAILKVQGALALSQGLSQIGELGKSFGILKVVAVEAFNAIKAAIGSTGIGLIVVAVGALVAYWDDIKVAIGGATTAQIKNLEQATKILDIEKQRLDVITSQNNILKQQGLSQQEILDIENKQLQTTILAAQKQLEAQKIISGQAIKAAVDQSKGALAGGGLGWLSNFIFGKPEDVKRNAEKTILEAQIGLNKLKDQLAANQLTIIASTVAFNEKIISLNHAAQEAGITDQYVLSQLRLKDTLEQEKAQIAVEYTNLTQRNELLKATQEKYDAESAALAKANRRKLNDDLRKLNLDAYTQGILDASIIQQLQLKAQLEADIKQTKLDIENVKDRNEKILALQNDYDAKVSAIRLKNLQDFQDKYTQSIIAAQVAEQDKQLSELEKEAAKVDEVEQRKAEAKKHGLVLDKEISDAHLDLAGQQAATELANLAGNAEAEASLFKEYERQKTIITEAENMARLAIISGVLAQASSLFSQHTLAYKVLAIAQATIDTYQSAVSSYKSLSGIPIVGPALGIAAAAVAVAVGLANIKKIVSVQVPGGTGGSVPSIGAGASAPLQATPQVGNTQLPQQQINQIGNSAEPVRAFVVESDVSGSQERVTRLNRAARLGG